jgi:protein tyrosine phosphatase
MDLIAWVSGPGFESNTEYAQLNALDNRHVAIGRSKAEAVAWNRERLNRWTHTTQFVVYICLYNTLFHDGVRYISILPYDTTRVVIQGSAEHDVNGISNCDYINASWIRKERKSRQV